MRDDYLGESCYNAYKRKSEGKSLVSGNTLPAWDNLPAVIRDAWNAAAAEVRRIVQASPGD